MKLTLSLAAAMLAGCNAMAAPDSPAHWKLAPTPPMGWNSYNAFGSSVTEQEFLANATPEITLNVPKHGSILLKFTK
jgi:alpha-galactosidase